MNYVIEPMLRPLTRWAEESQRQACRNAMVASTALTAGRRERDEVQEFIETTLARRGVQRHTNRGLEATVRMTHATGG